jgi:hypothetical protein
MEEFAAVTFQVTLGNTFEGTVANWDPADTLDGFKLRQADTAAGGNVKDITGAANVQTAVGTAGDQHEITVYAESLDLANGFLFVAAYVSEAGNTGTDIVQIIAIRHGARYKHDALGGVDSRVVTP